MPKALEKIIAMFNKQAQIPDEIYYWSRQIRALLLLGHKLDIDRIREKILFKLNKYRENKREIALYMADVLGEFIGEDFYQGLQQVAQTNKIFRFLSRHGLTEDQKQDLKNLGFSEFESKNPGIILSADEVINLAQGADAIGLVAPGRIWGELIRRKSEFDFEIYEAESRQAPELRKGDEPIPFVHVKWHKVI